MYVVRHLSSALSTRELDSASVQPGKKSTKTRGGPTRPGNVVFDKRCFPRYLVGTKVSRAMVGLDLKAGRPRPGKRRREAKCPRKRRKCRTKAKPPADMMYATRKRIQARSAERGKSLSRQDVSRDLLNRLSFYHGVVLVGAPVDDLSYPVPVAGKVRTRTSPPVLGQVAAQARLTWLTDVRLRSSSSMTSLSLVGWWCRGSCSQPGAAKPWPAYSAAPGCAPG